MTQRQTSTLLHRPQFYEMHRGLVYVLRRVNGVDVPLLIDNQQHYREYAGCFSAI